MFSKPSEINWLMVDGIGIVQLDPYLEPYKGTLQSRFAEAQKWIKTIEDTEGGLEKFSRVSASQSTSKC